MNEPNRLLRHRSANLLLAGANYSVAGASIATGPLVAHILGVSGRGQYAVGITAVLFAAAVSALGLVTTLNGRGSVYSVSALWAGTSRWRRVSLALGLALVFPVALVAHIVGLNLMAMTVIAGLSAVCNPYTTVTVAVLTASGEFGKLFAARMSTSITLVGGLMLMLLTHTGSPVTVIALYVTTAHLPALFGIGHGAKSASEQDTSAVRTIVREDVPSAAVYSVLTLGNARLDQTLLPATLSNAQIGLYAVATNYGASIGPLATTVSSIAMRSTAKGHNYHSTLRRLIPVVLGTVILAGGAHWLLPLLFGSKFRSGQIAALIMCFAGLVQATAVILTGQLIARGHARRTLGGGILAFVSIALCLPLSAALGPAGAAVASVICYSIDVVWQSVQLRLVNRSSTEAG